MMPSFSTRQKILCVGRALMPEMMNHGALYWVSMPDLQQVEYCHAV